MISLVTSASRYLSNASAALAQTSYGPLLLRLAAHWNLPLGATVGYGINAYKKICNYPAVGTILALATIYFGGASAAAGILLGASAAGRDLGIPPWIIGVIDYAGKATIFSMLMSLGAFTRGIPLLERSFIGALAYKGYQRFQEKFTPMTATAGLALLYACAGTGAVVTFTGLLYIQSIEDEPATTAEREVPLENFSTYLGIKRPSIARTEGVVHSFEELQNMIMKIQKRPKNTKKEALIKFADDFHATAKKVSGKSPKRALPNESSPFKVYKAWYQAWALLVHPDKNSFDGAEPLFQSLSIWYSEVESLKGIQIQE